MGIAKPKPLCKVCGQPCKRHGRDYCSKQCSGAAARTRVTVQCERCGKPFEAIPAVLAKGYGKYCSQECYGHAPLGERLCETCGQPIKSRSRRTRYCSHKCHGEAMVKQVECECPVCGTTFHVKLCHSAKVDRPCCSRACLSALQARRATRRCMICMREFVVRPSEADRKCCSMTCRNRYLKAGVSKNAAAGRRSFYGADNPNWRGDRAKFEHERQRWYVRGGGTAWAARCKTSAGNRCERCHFRQRVLHAHHRASYSRYASLRDEHSNGIALCPQCHYWVHSNAGREQREAWEQEALAELWHLLTDEERERAGQTIRNHQPTLPIPVYDCSNCGKEWSIVDGEVWEVTDGCPATDAKDESGK